MLPRIASLALALAACQGSNSPRVRDGASDAFGPALPTTARCLYVIAGGRGEHLGIALTALADLDGDGRVELLIGSRRDACERGGSAIRPFSLRARRALYTHSERAADQDDAYGERLCSLGDVDGDRVADIAVAAWRADGGRGVVEILSGRDGTRLARIEGMPPSEQGLGAALCAAGDVDGDGHGDVAIGLAGGTTKVFSGRDGVLLASFEGTPLALSGDIDGDGQHDLLVFAGPPRDAAMEWSRVPTGARVVSMRSGATLLEIVPEIDAAAMDVHGQAGDLDHDGFVDWLAVFEVSGTGENASIPGPRDRRVQAYSGRTGKLLMQFSVRLAGRGRVHLVKGIGDIDGDGLGDLIVGWHVDEGTPQGFVELHRGTDGALLHALSCASWSFGTSACALPDQDADGRSEVAVGDYQASAEERGGGRVYVFSFPRGD